MPPTLGSKLQPAYLARLLVLRLALLSLCLSNLDTFLKQLAAAQPGSLSPWSWPGRLAMAGLQLPLLLNLWGFMWPMCHATTFATHHRTYHQVLVYVTITGKVLEQLSGWAGGSSCMQALLLQGTLFVVHQDPAYITTGLAPMVAAYSLADAWTRQATSISNLQAGELPAAEQLLQGTMATGFFAHCVMWVILVQQLLSRLVGPSEQRQARPSAVAVGRTLSSIPASCRTSFGRRTVSSMRSTYTDCAPARSLSMSSHAAAPPQLSRTYVVKLALVKLCDAFFPALVAWQFWEHGSIGSSSSSSSSSSQQMLQGGFRPAWVLAVHAATQAAHAGLFLWQPSWLQPNLDAVNRVCFFSDVGARFYLIRVYSSSILGSEAVPSEAAKALAKLAFHSFLTLTPSLIVHEAPWRVFAVKLLILANLFRGLQLRLLVGTGAAPWNPLVLPEYLLTVLVGLALQPTLCLGRYTTDQDSTRGRFRRSRSSVASTLDAKVSAPLDSTPATAATTFTTLDSQGQAGQPPLVPSLQLGTDSNSVSEAASTSITRTASKPSAGLGASRPSIQRRKPSRSPSQVRAQPQNGRSLLSRTTSFKLPEAADAGLDPAGDLDSADDGQNLSAAAAAAAAVTGSGSNSVQSAVNHVVAALGRSAGTAMGWLKSEGLTQALDLGKALLSACDKRQAEVCPVVELSAVSADTCVAWLPQSPHSDGELDDPPHDDDDGPQDTNHSNSSPFCQAPHAAAADAPSLDDTGVTLMQRVAIDITAILLCLPFSYTMTADILRQVWQPQQPIDMVARTLAFLGCAFLLITWWAHAVVRCWRPHRSALHRESWWLAVMLWSCLAQQVATHLVRLKPAYDPYTTLNILGVGFAVLQMQPHLIGKWLPLACTVSYGLQAMEVWSTTPWRVLMVEALEFNLVPMLNYGLMWAVYPPCHTFCWRLIYSVMVNMGGPKVTIQPVRRMIAAAVVAHQLVASLPMWVPLLAAALPDAWNPVMLLGGAKASLDAMLDRLDLEVGAQTDTLQTLVAVLAIGLCFLVVSSLQALILASTTFRSPRQAWYEAAKGRVAGLGEATMSALQGLGEHAGPAELQQALIDTLRALVKETFSGYTLMLVLPEEDLEGTAVQRHLLQAGPATGSTVPEVETLLLEELPSLAEACEQGCVLFKTGITPVNVEYEDWADLAAAHGVDSIMVVPLTCAGQDLGALVLAARLPAVLDAHLQRLASDLGHALSQTLYTLACIGQMRAGEAIIQDIMPQKVAEQLRKRLVTNSMEQNSMSRSHSLSDSGPRLTDSHHQPLLTRLSEAASALREQQVLLQQQESQQPRASTSSHGRRSSTAAADGDRLSSLKGDSEVPVVYKQWHPAVSVLFADISGYTALSTQVEPEQVMLLLHELFSKYDHLCKRFGIYKVETIGDCYMACSGLLVDNPDHAQHMVQFAKAMLGAAASVRNPLGGSVHIRVGVHSGRVMSGIVGSIRARYCLFGDTVNTASRMESTGVVDRIQVSEDTYLLLGDLRQDFELREAVSVKGKGVMQTYVLTEHVAASLLPTDEGA